MWVCIMILMNLTGIPPFMASLDSLKGQHDMKTNFKHIMEICGMVGFLEAFDGKNHNRNLMKCRSFYNRRRLNRELNTFETECKRRYEGWSSNWLH